MVIYPQTLCNWIASRVALNIALETKQTPGEESPIDRYHGAVISARQLGRQASISAALNSPGHREASLVQKRALDDGGDQALAEAREIVRIAHGQVPPHPMQRVENHGRNRQRWMPKMMEWRRLFGPVSPFHLTETSRRYPMPSWAQWHTFHLYLGEMRAEGTLPATPPSLLEHYRKLEQQLLTSRVHFDCPICYRSTALSSGIRRRCGKDFCMDCHVLVGPYSARAQRSRTDPEQWRVRSRNCPNCRSLRCPAGPPF